MQLTGTGLDAAPLAGSTYLYRKLANALLAGLPELNVVPFSADDFGDWKSNWEIVFMNLVRG